MTRLSILCGTGMTDLAKGIEGAETDTLRAETPWGEVPCIVVKVGGHDLLFIYRHHANFEDQVTPPHRIEHRGNGRAARTWDPAAIVSVWSVGTNLEAAPPGTVALASDVLDLTGRVHTFHDRNAVHADRTNGFNAELSAIALPDAPEMIIAQVAGPQFETPAEIRALSQLGATGFNMTIGGESRLVSETAIPHVGFCLASNWAAGQPPGDANAPVDHHAVESLAEGMRQQVLDGILRMADHLAEASD